MLVRRGHEVMTAQWCTGERGLKKKNTLSPICVPLTRRLFRIRKSLNVVQSWIIWRQPQSARKTQQKPCHRWHLPKYHLLSAPCPPTHLLPSCSRASVTLHGHNVKHWSAVFQWNRRELYLSSTADLSPYPRPKPPRISPVRVCLIAEGWRAQGSR